MVKISSGVVHKVPKDLRDALEGSAEVLERWNDLTPLARNEYICWMTSAKKDETRARRMRIGFEQLLEGKRRPCCWPGCSHRKA